MKTLILADPRKLGFCNIFLDTEFNPETLELLSVGMVSEDNSALHVANLDANLSLASKIPFLTSNVLDKLKNLPKADSDGIQSQMLKFVDTVSNGLPVQFWTWYGSYDFVVLSKMFGGMNRWPKRWPQYIQDLRSTIALVAPIFIHAEMKDVYEVDDRPFMTKSKHDALYDASQLRATWYHFWSWLEETQGIVLLHSGSR